MIILRELLYSGDDMDLYYAYYAIASKDEVLKGFALVKSGKDRKFRFYPKEEFMSILWSLPGFYEEDKALLLENEKEY